MMDHRDLQVAAAGSDGFDKFLGAYDPGYAPTGEAEALGQAVDDKHIVLVDVVDVVCCADDSAVAVGRVVVAAVELVHDQRGAVAADVLYLSQLRVGQSATGRVARVGGEDDRSAASNLGCDVLGVDVVAVLTQERNGDCGEVLEQSQHLVVCGVIGNEEAEIGIT